MILEQKFFKSLPKGSAWINKLSEFENRLMEVNHQIKELPAGYWVRRVKGTNIYKFRLNNKDRILFTYVQSREEGRDKELLFLSYVCHDEQIRKAKKLNHEAFRILEAQIEESEYIEDQVDKYIEEVYKEPINVTDLQSIVLRDEELIHLAENEIYLHYLSDEQYGVLQDINHPILLSGGGGTGKTVVLVHILELARRYGQKAIYLTHATQLLEEVQSAFQVFGNEGKESITFNSIQEMMCTLTNVERELVIGHKELLEWLKENQYKYRILERHDLYSIATEIRGVLKGYMGLEYREVAHVISNNQEILNIEDYLNIPKKYSIFEIEERREIYKVVKAYQKWLEAKGYYDENDLARKILQSQVKGQYDWVVIDEVQDLTEVQIYVLSQLLVDGGHIIWAGDMNQTIYPTFFNFGRLKNLYYSYDKELEFRKLTKNYRGTYEITSLINTLMTMKASYIGKSSYDYEETAIRHGEIPGIIGFEQEKMTKMLQSISDKHYCAVIVPNKAKKEELTKMYQEIEGRIFLPQEIKGLEYENIYCYDLMSTYIKKWKKILGQECKNDESMKYYFNLLYVGMSRAKNRLYIYESQKDLLNLEIFESCLFIDEYDEELVGIVKQSTKDDWDSEAKKLQKVGQKEHAQFARDLAKEEKIKKMNRSVDESYSKHFINMEKVQLGTSHIEKLLEPALNAYVQRKYVEASELLDELLDKYPEEDIIYYYLGNVYTYMAGGCESALDFFAKAIELNPNVYEYYLDYAAVFYALGKNQAVVEVLDRAITYFPYLGNAYETKSLVYSRVGMKELEIEMNKLALKYPKYRFDFYKKKWTRVKSSPEKGLNLPQGIEYLTFEGSKVQSKCIKGIDLANIEVKDKQKVTLLKFDREFCELCEERMQCIQSKADDSGILRIKDTTLKMAARREKTSTQNIINTKQLPDSPSSVLSHEEQLKRHELMDSMRKLLASNDLIKLVNKCGNDFRAGNIEEAIRSYQKALEKLEGMSEEQFEEMTTKEQLKITIWGGLGNSFLMQGNYEEAIKYLEMASAFEHIMCSEPLNSLGVIKMRTGKYDEAVEYFERALKYNKSYTEASDNLKLCRQLKQAEMDLDMTQYPAIDASKINAVISRLEKLKEVNQYLDTIPEESYEYESLCEKMVEYFGEITDVLLKGHKIKLSLQTMQQSMFLNMAFWNYLKGTLTFSVLLEQVMKYYEATK